MSQANLKQKIQDEMKVAMRSKDKERLAVIRLIQAAIKQIEVDERVEVDDDRMLLILEKMQKQRKESIKQYQEAGRDDLVAKEQFETTVIQEFLPQPFSEDEVAAIVQQAVADTNAQSMADMGKVMGQVKPKLQGRADMTVVSKLVKAQLAN